MPGAKAVHDLPFLTWIGTKIYTKSVRTSWAHRLPRREFLDVDGAAHDNTGREELRVDVTALFHNTIEPDLYPKRWNQVRQTLLERKAGELRHPEIGIFNARPAQVAYQLDPDASTAGVTVEISWIESIKSADQPSKFSVSSSEAAQAAADADVAIEQLGITYPDGMLSSSFQEMIAQIDALDYTLSFEINGLIGQCVGVVDACYNALQFDCKIQLSQPKFVQESLAASPFRWMLESALNTMTTALNEKLAALQGGGGGFLTYTAAKATTLADVSLELGVDVGSLVRLNPMAVAKPKIAAGTKLQYLAP